MRDIKFRAWNGKELITKNVCVIDDKFAIEEDNMDWSFDFGATEIIGMQYTGLKDKNGVEIFEGDVVKWGHLKNSIELSGARVAVVSLDPALQFEAFLPRKHTFEYGCFMYQETNRYLEVIGNIHENPELLEGEQ